jgi:deazaflavin-dependent oxidoreductase (nitroreductase family)
MAVDYLAWADRNWGILARLMGGHAKVYRATRGLIGQHFPGLPEMCLLDHVGAKSGIERTTPLVFARETRASEPLGSNIVLIASKGGYPKNPAWYHNLKANPDTTVQIGPKLIPVRAREAKPEEYDRLWALAVEVYPGYEAYRRRTERKIPLMVLEPR